MTLHLLALWLALCCCQWRIVASGVGLDGFAGASSCCSAAAEKPQAAPDCCSALKSECCTTPAERACCHESAPADEPPHEGGCSGCCDKAADGSSHDPLSPLLALTIDHLGTMVLHWSEPAAICSAIRFGVEPVWHPPPGRLRPLLCILTV